MIAGILLAAGESSRMGQCKLLLPYSGCTVIEHIVNTALTSCIERLVVVLGHSPESIQPYLRPRPLSIVGNPNYAEGMLSSIRCGLTALPSDTTCAVLLLGDQPTVTTEIIDELVHAWEESDRGIVVPVFDGKRGHPLVFSFSYRDEIMTKYDSIGLRGLLQTHQDDVTEFVSNTRAVLDDMDTPEDYQQLLQRRTTSE